MSRPGKVILIVFGSLALLCVALMVVLIAFVLPKFGHQALARSGDPKLIAAVRKSMPEIHIPPGYFAAAAFDMGFAKNLTIMRNDNSPSFRITVQETITMVSGNAEKSTEMGKSISTRFLCKERTNESTTIVRRRRGDTTIRRLRCRIGRREYESEMAWAALDVRGKIVRITADGSHQRFDIDAVRRIVASAD